MANSPLKPAVTNAVWMGPRTPSSVGMSPTSDDTASHRGAAVRYQPAAPSLSPDVRAVGVIDAAARSAPTAMIARAHHGASWPVRPVWYPSRIPTVPAIVPTEIRASDAVASGALAIGEPVTLDNA